MVLQISVSVINLPRETARRAFIGEQLRDQAGFDSEFVEAVDGDALAPADLNSRYSDQHARHRAGRSFSRGELGCALSHQRVYQRLLEADDEWRLVLEDDALLDPRTHTILAQSDSWLRAAAPRVLLLTPLRAFVERGAVPVAPGIVRVRVLRAWDGAGYALNRAAARALLQANTPVSLMADDWVAHRRRTGIELAGLNPYLVRQDGAQHSAIEATRDEQRRHKRRTLRYRGNKAFENTRNAVAKWLWWRPFFGYRRH